MDWMKRLRETYKHYITKPNTQHRIRIAVLDTGADLSHPDIDIERIKSVRTWVKGKNGEEEDRLAGDDCGHGTQNTGTLLDLVPDADIFIAQIASKEPTHPSQIAKAQYPLHHTPSLLLKLMFNIGNYLRNENLAG